MTTLFGLEMGLDPDVARSTNTYVLLVVNGKRHFRPSTTAPNTESTGTYAGSIDAASLGDTIAYEYSVTNDGTTTMSHLILNDSAVGLLLSRVNLSTQLYMWNVFVDSKWVSDFLPPVAYVCGLERTVCVFRYGKAVAFDESSSKTFSLRFEVPLTDGLHT